ncbi:MAG: anthranilate synthase component I [Granulosicoccaceae bacterium]
MTPDQFQQYAEAGYNRLPVSRQILADMDTPLSTYVKLASQPYTYLLESVQGGEKWGRYSVIGLPCREVIQIRERTVQVLKGREIVSEEAVADPLQWIEQYMKDVRVPELTTLPRMIGGLVGYFGYDTIRYIEPKLDRWDKIDPIDTPDICLMVSDEVVVFDNLNGTLHIVSMTDPALPDAWQRAQGRLDDIEAQMQRSAPYSQPHRKRSVCESEFGSGFTQDGFKAAVDTCREYIAAGDCMQVVLSQRMSVPYSAQPLDLYRALRVLNPSPYMYFLNLGDHHVVGASPEILVREEEGEVHVRPLAGTRPRGATEAEDQRLEVELLADPKEIAEHLMLIDLGRNDVGRISEMGSVRVTEEMTVERYSHVMHIVSNVQGTVREGMSPLAVLRATFPAGTLSGAPKIRAMEILDELEPVKRGVYGGAVGYLSWNGNMDLAIAIRTAVIKDHTLYVQAGAGLVYDSVPESEWQETLNKGRALFRAVAMAEAGLELVPVNQERGD